MKKFSHLVGALALGSALTVTPALANYHIGAAVVQQFKSDDERALYEKYYNEKDLEKKAVLAKEFKDKFPNSDFVKYAEATIAKNENAKQQKIYQAFQTALQDFYKAPDAGKLDQLITASQPMLAKDINPSWVNTQIALATGYGVLAGLYKDVEKANSYAETALKQLEPSAAPTGWKADEWAKFRTEQMSRLTQYQGLYKLRQGTPDAAAAVTYLNKAIEMKDGPAAKDPNTYLLRAEANNTSYERLSAEYSGLSEDDKRSDKGKAALAKIDPVVDSLIDDYARVVAIASKNAALKPMLEDTRPRLESFWKYRHNNKLDGMNEYVKRYEADPTLPPPPPTAASPATTPGAKPSGK